MATALSAEPSLPPAVRGEPSLPPAVLGEPSLPAAVLAESSLPAPIPLAEPAPPAAAPVESSLQYREEVLDSDIKSVRAIVESSGFFSAEEVEVAVELAVERLSRGIRSGYHFLFGELSGCVVGYGCFGPVPGTRSSFNLYWVAVHDRYRGLGIGRRMMARVEAAISLLGGKHVWVETSSRPQYEPTRSFYRSHGYKQVAVLADFYAPGDDKLIYLKLL